MAASPIGPSSELPFLASSGQMGELIAGKDWSGTALGPPTHWPATLRGAIGIMLRSRFPMFLAWGPQLAFLYNDAYIPILGKKHPDAVGHPFEQVWHDIWPVIEPLISAALANEPTYQEDLLLVMQRSGSAEETYFTFSYGPIPAAEGPPAGLFCACTDTTARVVGERRLRTLRKLGEISAAQAPTARDALSAALEVLAGNRADVPHAMAYLLDDDGVAARLVGSYGLAPGSSAMPATLPHPDADPLIWRVAASGTAELITGLSRRYAGAFLGGASPAGDDAPDAAMVLPLVPAGGERPVAVLVATVSPYRGLDADYRTFYELLTGQVTTAVTDALAYQAERARAAALAELDRVKTEFFATISHEFRTPLTLITGPVAELCAAPTLTDGPQLREELAVIHRNGLRLGKLVNTLLDFSRLQAGRAQAVFEPVDLPAFTAELASVFRAAIERAGLALRVDCPPLPEPAYLDRQMWEKIVLNLLSNALKFTFTGTVTVSVHQDEPSADGGTRRAVLEVTDTGIGIPADEVDRLFERFHQVAGAQGRSAEGSGIGLALVREFVALHGGTVTVRSTVGAGSTFAVAIPLGHEHLPAEQVQPSSSGAASSTASDITGELFVAEALRWLPAAADAAAAAADAARVLIADDNADMREYLTRLLSRRYQVHAVPDGAAALAAARAQVPDLVLTDVMMPNLDGFGLLAQLRADQRTTGIPVIMLSARAGEEAAVEGLAASADDYLVKPFTATELMARVDSHLALSRLRRREQQQAAAQLHTSQEALRLLSDYADDVIARHAPDGTWRYVSPSIQRLSGHRPEELVGRSPLELIHPDDHDTVHALLTSLSDGPAEATMRLRRTDGSYLWMETRTRLVHDADRDGWEIHSVSRDVTVRVQAEQVRQQMTAERAARAASDAAAARMRSMVDGLNAIVWEADAVSGRASFVSERVEEVLGYPATRWVGKRSDAWRSIIHPEDRDEVVRTRVQATAAGRDHDLTYRAITADGRVVWLHDLVHVACDAGGSPRRLQGVMIDITERKRAEQAAALLAEVGRIQTEPGSLTQRLTALAQAAVAVLADLAVVSVLRLDGMLHPVTAVHPGRGDIERTVLGYPPHRLPAQLLSRCQAGRPITAPTPYPELPYPELGVQTTLLVPLVVHSRLLATLTFSCTRAREYDDAELALAAELGQRAALMIETERVVTRERQLHEITAALSAAATAEQAAHVLVAGMIEVFDASAASVWIIQPGALQLVHQVGYPTEIMDRYRVMALDDAMPITECARTGAPVWLRDNDEWQDHYPHLVPDHALTGNRAFAALPLLIGSRVVGALTASFATHRDFDPDERSFAETLTGLAALAFERAALADTHARVADTLQRSLLPAALPACDRLALAARYLPGTPDVQAGGDWYDVLPLDQQRMALVAGDVVGQGPTAAAVMGQLRSALAGFLLEGHGPGTALHYLDRLAARVPGALASTAIVVVLDLATGDLRWCRAGHPPPLLLEGNRARYLTDGGFRLPLGLGASTPVPDDVTHLEPGACLLLYTDGLIERRGQAIDEGLDQLAATAAALGFAPPDALLDQLLAAAPCHTGPADDIALVAARYLPAPLHQRLPAEPSCLPGLRRMVSAWTTAAGLAADHVDNLQLALGEAAANAAEHAYAGREPGEFEVHLTYCGDSAIEVRVQDYGAWRPEPAGNEHRGRGLDMIYILARGVVLTPSSTGTTITFQLPAPAAVPLSVPINPTPINPTPINPNDHPPVPGDRSPDPEPVSLVLHQEPGRTRRLELRGELDLAATATLRRPLLDHLAAPGPVILDLRGLHYLASAGVGLLIEAAHHATTHSTPLQLLLTPHSVPARILTLTGLTQLLPITPEPRLA